MISKIQAFLDKLRRFAQRWRKRTDTLMVDEDQTPPALEEPSYEERPNSNYNTRPGTIDMIIIHAVGLRVLDDDGKVWDGDQWIAYKGYSYHGLVRPDGTVLITVPREKRAWHAGISAWQRVHDLNDNSIGFAAMIDHDPLGYGNFLQAMKDPVTYTPAHYSSLGFLCVQAMKRYPQITLDRILRHSQVSGKNVRPDPKHDPGDGFDMDRLKSTITQINERNG